LFVHLRKAPIRPVAGQCACRRLRHVLLQLVVGIVDIVLVSSILYPAAAETAMIAFLPFLAIYLASIPGRRLSHVPAGLGVLESMLLLAAGEVPPSNCSLRCSCTRHLRSDSG